MYSYNFNNIINYYNNSHKEKTYLKFIFYFKYVLYFFRKNKLNLNHLMV